MTQNHPSKRLTGADIAASLRQTQSASKRRQAILTFGKALRRADRFQPAWDAVGGAHGLAALMAEFSVRDIRAICRCLGRTAAVVNAAAERRAALAELVKTLYSGTYDIRPLQSCYQDIVPACGFEAVQALETKSKVDWTHFQKKRLFFAYRQENERRFLSTLVGPNDTSFAKNVHLLQGNLDFCETVLSTIATHDGPLASDFMTVFAMPLLERLRQRRNHTETRVKFLDLVVRCVEKHPKDLQSHMHLRKGGLVQFVLRQWEARRPYAQGYLVRVLRIVGTQHYGGLRSIFKFTQTFHQSSFNPDHTPRRFIGSPTWNPYPLFRLLLLHLEGYRLDIDDDSDAGLERLRKVQSSNKAWPLSLFTWTDPATALALLERLNKVDPKGNFLEAPSTERSIFRQTRHRGDHRGDVEVCRAHLLYRLGGSDLSWLDRVRGIIEDRKKKAAQGRDPQDRGFWAASAVNLCVAAGDLQTLEQTVIWTRRFDKDPLTSRALCDDAFLTTNLEGLLCVIPEEMSDATVTAAEIRSSVEIANRIALELTRLAMAAVSEPGFTARHQWRALRDLPFTVMDRRLDWVAARRLERPASLMLTDSEMNDAVWKPTITTVMEADTLRDPSAAANHSLQLTWAPRFPDKLSGASPEAMAELATFILDTMKARLGPETLRANVGTIVDMTMGVARSDQPALACPFIRHAIINDGGENSSWHRRLVTTKFLSSLPAKNAREFLYTIAGAIRDLMKEQNARPWQPDDAPDTPNAPRVKVTTIKMMAEILRGNVYLDALSSTKLLISLLDEARHVHARMTLVSSLISILEDPTCPRQMRQRILAALETMVPVAARMNERRPDDWDGIPDVGEDTPLLDMLVERAGSSKLCADGKTHLARIIMDILTASAENNGRWMLAFQDKHRLSVALPASPVNPARLVSLFEGFTDSMPLSLFNMMRAIVMANLDPSPQVAHVRDVISNDRQLVDSNAGQHWLRLFNNTGSTAFGLGLSQAVQVLLRGDSKPPREITDTDLHGFIFAAAKAIVRRGETGLLDELVNLLCNRRPRGRDAWLTWRSKCIPVVVDIIDMIETLRSSPDRPPLLPNTLRLRIKTLPVPFSTQREHALAQDVDVFVKELSALIDRLALRVPYHIDFERLRLDLASINRWDLAPVAVALAAMDDVAPVEDPPLAAYLRLELTADFLKEAVDPSLAITQDARTLIHVWKTCKAEGLRVMGQQVELALAGKGTKGWYSAGLE